ncbi:MAG: DUF2442 domain-containing protein [Nitrospirales bacterium]|nr:DUF2442 domain-containing protein [Nitrospirales bacterium]
MLLIIDEARYLGNYRFSLCFNGGRSGTVDIRPLADEEPKAAFAQLADEAFVSRFSMEHGTLCWPGDLDVAPEYLYFLTFRDNPALHDQFAAWGYLKEAANA